jgi:hypothetical protein
VVIAHGLGSPLTSIGVPSLTLVSPSEHKAVAILADDIDEAHRRPAGATFLLRPNAPPTDLDRCSDPDRSVVQ